MDELWKLESVELSESRQFVAKLCERLKSTRDPALLGELVEYYYKNGSKRARTVLTSLREAHSQVLCQIRQFYLIKIHPLHYKSTLIYIPYVGLF